MPHGLHPGRVGTPHRQAGGGHDGHFRDGGVSAREPGLRSHGPGSRRKRLAQMNRSQEDNDATQDRCFEEAAAWHARWKSASGAGLSAEDVDQWVLWSKISENKVAYDAVQFVSRAKFA